MREEETLLRQMLRGKIHRATVTQTELHYPGSITVDATLLEAADILPGEKVQVVNVMNGARLETYTIAGEPGSGVVCLNGPAARLGALGDRVIIISYAVCDETEARRLTPRVVDVDAHNYVV